MTTAYLVVQPRAWMNEPGYGIDYISPLVDPYPTRQAAIDAGLDHFDHDDFSIATLVDGKLAAIGWMHDDFTPEDADLPEVARHLCYYLAEAHVVAAGGEP